MSTAAKIGRIFTMLVMCVGSWVLMSIPMGLTEEMAVWFTFPIAVFCWWLMWDD